MRVLAKVPAHANNEANFGQEGTQQKGENVRARDGPT